MIVLLRRRTLWGLSLIALGCGLLLGSLAHLHRPAADSSAVVNIETEPVLIWDAGHGGADGGAVSANGVPESGINLAIAERCDGLCRFLGLSSTMTRKSSDSLADEEATTIRQQKVSDTRNRVALVNSFADAVLISIHQNSLPAAPQTHGAMVFYNGIVPAADIGDAVQATLNNAVNVGNEKQSHAIGKDIYLMTHVNCPAVLVECGFMSHSAEAAQLEQSTYQTALAAAIVCGYLSYKGEGI